MAVSCQDSLQRVSLLVQLAEIALIGFGRGVYSVYRLLQCWLEFLS